jgi:hypothetical protein
MARLSSKLTTKIIGDSSRSEASLYLSLVLLLVEKGIINEREILSAIERATKLIDKELQTGAVDLRKYHEERLSAFNRLFKTDDKLSSAISIHKQANRNKTSRFHGVDYCQRSRKWRARIKVIGEPKARYLGEYDEEIKAAEAYNIAAQAVYGEYAQLNDISVPRKKSR